MSRVVRQSSPVARIAPATPLIIAPIIALTIALVQVCASPAFAQQRPDTRAVPDPIQIRGLGDGARAVPDPIQIRALGVQPLADVSPGDYSAQRAQTYGVFIGVDRFDDESIPPLLYGAADARAVRDTFVDRLGYLPPENARLLVTGAQGDDRPTRVNILRAINRAATRAGPEGSVVVHISTHGIEGYVLASDSYRDVLEDTAVSLELIQTYLSQSPSPRRLLLFDACREVKSSGGARGILGGMSSRFSQAFAQAEGFAVLMSCSEGQYSYEMPESGHGVFTHFLLEGLGGAAPANADGLITVTGLASWVKSNVEDWTRTKSAGVQSPRFDLREATGDMPLAVSGAYLAGGTSRELAEMHSAGDLTTEQHRTLQTALVSGDARRARVAIDVAAGRVSPGYVDQLLQSIPVDVAIAQPSAAVSQSAPPAPVPIPVEPSRFQVNRDATVYDRELDADWYVPDERETYTFSQASRKARGLRIGERRGWRLPSESEIESLRSDYKAALEALQGITARVSIKYWLSNRPWLGEGKVVSFGRTAPASPQRAAASERHRFMAIAPR